HAGRFTCPTGVNDYLHVRNVGERVQRNMLYRPYARESQHHDRGKHQEPVPFAPFNDSGDHRYIPPSALTVKCFVPITRPFCRAVIVTCHEPPEPRFPLPSYKPPP